MTRRIHAVRDVLDDDDEVADETFGRRATPRRGGLDERIPMRCRTSASLSSSAGRSMCSKSSAVAFGGGAAGVAVAVPLG